MERIGFQKIATIIKRNKTTINVADESSRDYQILWKLWHSAPPADEMRPLRFGDLAAVVGPRRICTTLKRIEQKMLLKVNC